MKANNDFIDFEAEMRNIGSRIRSYREMRGLNRDELGKAIGVEEGEVSAIEAGSKDLGFLLLLSLSNALEISPKELFK